VQLRRCDGSGPGLTGSRLCRCPWGRTRPHTGMCSSGTEGKRRRGKEGGSAVLKEEHGEAGKRFHCVTEAAGPWDE